MKRITAIILAVILVLSMAACGKNDQPSSETPDSSTSDNSTAEPDTAETSTDESPTAEPTDDETSAEPSSESEVKGTVHEFGRFSVLVPEGWEAADMGEYQTDYNGIIVKGKGEDFMTASTASILYCLPSEMVVSGRGFYDNTRNLGEFDLGGHHWESWSGYMTDTFAIAAESFDEDGTIVFTLTMPPESDVKLSLEDPDVRAILESIVVVPTVDVEWITIKDGTVSAELPEVEGYTWYKNDTMSSDSAEASVTLEGSRLTITPESGTGSFSVGLLLENEEEDVTFHMGEAKISIRVTDGKADGIYSGVLIIYDEPEEAVPVEFEDNTDYEFLAELYSGTWADNKNDLTLFIETTDEVEHGCLINIQSDNGLISATGIIQQSTYLEYEGCTINGEFVNSEGYFMPDGDLLIWGHDETVGEFEFGTIFTKIE